MDISLVIQKLLLGGILGLVGQGIRLLAGLKKLSESSVAQNGSQFDSRRLLVSLLLGFIADALGSISLLDEQKADTTLSNEQILTLIGAGYAGVDFIESFLTKFVPKQVSNQPPTNQPSLSPSSGAPGPQVITYMQVPTLPYSSK